MDEGRDEVELVYREVSSRLWRALVGATGDREIASDAVAEAFARAMRDRDSIRDLRAWVWRVAFRVALADLRRRPPPSMSVEDLAVEGPDGGVSELLRGLMALSPNQRLAIVLHDYADRPTTEVADVLGCSRATVYVHLSQGRRRMRSLLEESDA